MKSFSSFFFGGLLAFLLLAGGCPVAAQAPAWQSARAVAAATVSSTTNASVVLATAVDATGNVYLGGYFANTVTFGGITLTGFGSSDAFVAKFNPISNQFVWAQRVGGSGNDYITALAVSGGSLYVAGHFGSSTLTIGTTTLTKAGPFDVFVAKLIDTGPTASFAWAQQAGGSGDDQAYALAVRGSSVYVAGQFGGPTAGFGTNTLTNAGLGDIFVAKLTDAGSTGSFAWAQQAGGSGNDYLSALAVSGTGVYIAGQFGGPTAGFGATTLTTAGGDDVFVAKLTDAGPTGSYTWAQRAGSAGGDQANALAVSGSSVYVAGNFAAPTASFGTTTLTSSGLNDVFVAKLTDTGSTGSYAWVQQAGGPNDDRAFALTVSGPNVYVGGYFRSSTVDFGPSTLTNAGGDDAFVAKLTDAGGTGSFAWGQWAGGMGGQRTYALALSGRSVYVGGYLQSPSATFGPTTINNPDVNSTPLGFLATLTDPTLTATTTAPPREPLTLSPNPAHHTATLRLPAGTPPAPLTLTDAQGRTVRRYPAPAGPTATLDLRGLPAGLYLLGGAGRPQRLLVE